MKIIGSQEFHMCRNFDADILWKSRATAPCSYLLRLYCSSFLI